MSDSTDLWPLPRYYCGAPELLHAIGVISLNYNAFERGVYDLCAHYLTMHKVPKELVDFFYLSLNERTRVEATRRVISIYEKEQTVVDIAENQIKYFDWCFNARNFILHSEHYPALFGRPDEIELSKRRNKKSAEIGYSLFDLPRLRDIADKMHDGKTRCASLRVYLRQRDTPQSEWPLFLRAIGPEPLPEKFEIPAPLELKSDPQHPGSPFQR